MKNYSPEQARQEEKEEAKLVAFGINERARRASNQKVRESAAMWADKLMSENADIELRNLRLVEDDLDDLIGGGASGKDLKKSMYKGWSREELRELADILYGEKSGAEGGRRRTPGGKQRRIMGE